MRTSLALPWQSVCASWRAQARFNAHTSKDPQKYAWLVQGGVITGTPTRVVCLRNMVGPGEVDPDLEDEVANECSKYGQVQSVMIFEVTTAGYPDDQAVRIFVEFERLEQATKVISCSCLRFCAICRNMVCAHSLVKHHLLQALL